MWRRDGVNTEAGKHPAWCHVTFKMQMDADRRFRRFGTFQKGSVGSSSETFMFIVQVVQETVSFESSRISNTNMGD